MHCLLSIYLNNKPQHVSSRLTAHQEVNVKGKCKAIPLQAWTGPEGSRRLRLPDFKTIGT
jgi:hypothetical protein